MDELENWRNKDIWIKRNRKWRLKTKFRKNILITGGTGFVGKI